jgi:hypothetical protein
VHAHVQRLVSVVKMATVFEDVLPKSRVLLYFFCGQKDPMQRIFIKNCFLFTVDSVCRVKRFTTGLRNSLKDFRKSQMIPEQIPKWLRQQSKHFYAAGFDALGQVYQCWLGKCREIIFFSGSNIAYFTFHIHL